MNGLAGSANRVWALVLRYLYLLRGSWPRILEQCYWPTVQMIMWGFITRFLTTTSDWVAQAAGVLIGAVLFWDMLFRAQIGVSTVFMEEMFARNLGQLFASPLRPGEMVAALTLISLARTVIGVLPAVLLAIPLYQYSLFEMGLPLIAFFVVLLMFGWSVGLFICAALLRFGLGVESLAWAAIFALAPLSGIYYPIATLPDWLEPIAMLLPSAHVFEGMRAAHLEQRFDVLLWLRGLGLTLAYLALGAATFLWTFRGARASGALLRTGE